MHQLGPRKKLLDAIDQLKKKKEKFVGASDELYQNRYRLYEKVMGFIFLCTNNAFYIYCKILKRI
jgi:hypothetical protein